MLEVALYSIDVIVRTASREVKLMFILRFGSNRNVFYLNTETSAACNKTPYYAHVRLYKECGYGTYLSVPCIIAM